jgi:hypothetical protein
MSYTITTTLGRDGDYWQVVRDSDGVKVMSSPDVKLCLRWVKTWGEVDLGR